LLVTASIFLASSKSRNLILLEFLNLSELSKLPRAQAIWSKRHLREEVSGALVPDRNCVNNTIGPSLPGPGVTTRRNHKARVAQALKEKNLAVSSQVRVATFSLPSANQADSPFLRAPAEIRNEIYELCVFKGRRFHLSKLSEGIKGFRCQGRPLSLPCAESTRRCLDGQINKISPERYRDIPRCPYSCKCAHTKFLALVRTCQLVYNETFTTMYRYNMFVISECVFAKHLKKQQTLSAALARIQYLQLNLGRAKYGSDPMIQSKHATLRIVKEHFTELRELCVTFTTLLQELKPDLIDDKSIRLIGRFRALTAFKLVVTHGWVVDQESYRRQNGKALEPARAVRHIEDIFKKFVKLEDLDDTTGLDELEQEMARDDSKFAIGMKQKVKARLAEE
jgi:hypothetical protein